MFLLKHAFCKNKQIQKRLKFQAIIYQRFKVQTTIINPCCDTYTVLASVSAEFKHTGTLSNSVVCACVAGAKRRVAVDVEFTLSS